jgi:hypothetical protein
MGIQIVWDDEAKTIIRHIYEGRWTVSDYYALIEENYRQIDSVKHRVDIINDLREMVSVPPNLVQAIRHAARRAHINEGINVLVASPLYVQVLVDAINKAVGEHTEVRHAPTLEKAYEIIAKHRAENPQQYGEQPG